MGTFLQSFHYPVQEAPDGSPGTPLHAKHDIVQSCSARDLRPVNWVICVP